ncbi:(S)-benzoin forming benzil reductase [Aquibacillus koreensis]|uniref:(S)-benzoin forming benzil reductase n=1 Tax=Aquibacillus koreensis TaxID=279446 RepID=A0A9X4AHY6_9BACI|nr:(S)-benzoin forming benzil reductase [Aquibacillus koreensis]MCT2535733.1 (S)-benzoin forming benzil reductase [Aquibacillus koreensis]MDC3420189.1 (S)-benzoin forming benzil reductase [Aquibacillus koreensis]
MKFAIVTGASRGLGESIATLLLKEDFHVIGVSRKKNTELEKVAKRHSVSYVHYACDLSAIKQVNDVFTEIANEFFLNGVESVHLINNAGTVSPMDQAKNYEFESISDHITVNLTAPMTTTALFLSKANESNVPVIITNVTSGAADRSVYGWSAYCSSKAGLNRFTETVAVEQDEIGTMNKVILFNPGIMDTEMQGEIRSSSEESFKDVETFRQYKQDKSLRDTDTVAKTLVDVLVNENQIINGKQYNVKELL